MRKMFALAVSLSVVIAGLLFSGWLLRRSPEEVAAMKTCEELGGYICEEGVTCSGEWLDASDTFRCCSCDCSMSQDEPLTIEPFEPAPENEDLGDPY